MADLKDLWSTQDIPTTEADFEQDGHIYRQGRLVRCIRAALCKPLAMGHPTQPKSGSAAQNPNVPYTDILIAVHGIGSQSRFSTVRAVANQFAGSKTLTDDGKVCPVAPQPLGYFNSDVKSMASIRLVDDAEGLKTSALEKIGFSEVFWADIPQEVAKEGRTLEETKAWARTVVARAKALCLKAKNDPARDASSRAKIIPPDFDLAVEVLDEIIETVYVLENLCTIAEKLGVFKFELSQLLEDYLGDIQLVTEFTYHRTDVIGRFHRAIEQIHQQYPAARLHIVAHSEGTVVSLLGLLHAYSGRRFHPTLAGTDAHVQNPQVVAPWLEQVRGFMTIGSPIDKHLLLWPRLWKDFNSDLAKHYGLGGKIAWRNYYDYGDPVGFKLETARLWLRKEAIELFEFCGCKKCQHDIGFSRYLFPGAAHNEYWGDAGVFEHFITNIVKAGSPTPRPPAPPPQTKPLIAFLSPIVPYFFCFMVLMLGVFVLFKAVHAYANPSLDSFQQYVRFRELGVTQLEGVKGLPLLGAVAGITGLIAGVTLLARFPRMALGKFWVLAGFLALWAGFGAYAGLVPRELRNNIGSNFWYLASYLGPAAPTIGILGVAAITGMMGYLVMCNRLENADRQKRWIFRGLRPLIICGAITIGFVVLSQFSAQFVPRIRISETQTFRFSPEEKALINSVHLSSNELFQVVATSGTNWISAVKNVKPLLAQAPPVWPVVAAGIAFLYLWWLATLLFDLTFVWHRYIRRSTTNRRLLEWNPYGLDPEATGANEICTNPAKAPSTPEAAG